MSAIAEVLVPVAIGNASVCLLSVLDVRGDKTMTERAIVHMGDIIGTRNM